MNIRKSITDNTLTLTLEGKLDTLTAPELRQVLKESSQDVTAVTMDFSQLSYMSSIGLSILLSLQKQLGRPGSLQIRHAHGLVKEVIEVSGFEELLTSE